MTTIVEYEVRCPVCDMKLPAKYDSDLVGKFKVLCVSKTCKKVWVVVDTRTFVIA